jgi:molybdenum cofactor biosynthesis protein B
VLDDVDAIRHRVWDLLHGEDIDIIVLNGGTGLSPSDVTPEAIQPLFDRSLDGFGELFRHLSFEEIGGAAMLSRACAGIVGRRALFALPGSPKAVDLAMRRLVLPEVGHLLGQVRRAT